MMSVVIVDTRTVDLGNELEAASRERDLGQRLHDGVEVEAQALTNRDCGERIARIVLSRHR